jgi:hypothetical protein
MACCSGLFFCLLVYLSADEKVSCDDAGSVIELKNVFVIDVSGRKESE